MGKRLWEYKTNNNNTIKFKIVMEILMMMSYEEKILWKVNELVYIWTNVLTKKMLILLI